MIDNSFTEPYKNSSILIFIFIVALLFMTDPSGLQGTNPFLGTLYLVLATFVGFLPAYRSKQKHGLSVKTGVKLCFTLGFATLACATGFLISPPNAIYWLMFGLLILGAALFVLQENNQDSRPRPIPQ